MPEDPPPSRPVPGTDADLWPWPVARLGIVGGGQLGRMLTKKAKQLGCLVSVLDPTPGGPAAQLVPEHVVGSPRDPDAVRRLADLCDVLTVEIEDVDVGALEEAVERGVRVHPSPAVLATVQDKLAQKRLLERHGIPTSAFRELAVGREDAIRELESFGYPSVQKLRRGGYDGRGVAVLDGPDDLDRFLEGPSLVERRVDLEAELAMMVARRPSGEVRCHPLVEMLVDPATNQLDVLLAPARVEPEVATRARELATATAEAFEVAGLLGVELFLDRDGELSVNEVAPRPHNSGHYTLEACVTDQFEQHVRAVLDLPLGETELLRPAAMVNLVGAPDERGPAVIRGLRAALALPGVAVHLYGKPESRPNRKMGHLTVLDPDLEAAHRRALEAARRLRIGARSSEEKR